MINEILFISKLFGQLDAMPASELPATPGGRAQSRVVAEAQVRKTVAGAESFADMSSAILKCYHRTAQFRFADVIEYPWSRQTQYGATKSLYIRINYVGVSSAKYTMMVGVLKKPDAFRAVIIDDNAKIRASTKCSLKDWVKASG